jgi:hypothetical protein
MLRIMSALTSLPAALRHPKGRIGKPVLVAAFGPAGVLVAAGQYAVAAAVAHFGADLTTPAVQTLGTGADVDYRLRAVTGLPDGRFLICTQDRFGWYVDGGTLAVSPADGLACVVPSGNNVSLTQPWPRDAFVLGDRLLLGHGSHFSNVDDFQWFTEVSLSGGPAVPWGRDLEDKVRAVAPFTYHWYLLRAAVLGDGLVAAGQSVLGSGSRNHALHRIDGTDSLREYRAWPRDRVRDATLALAADARHGVVLAYAKGVLEVVDERLATVAEVTGHPFLTAFRLLAGDGRGRLLWYGGRTRTLLVTEPDEIDPGALESSLDAVAAAARPQRPSAQRQG